MSLFAVGAIFLVLGLALVLLRALNRFDDVYSRLPHDRDLQELFRCLCPSFLPQYVENIISFQNPCVPFAPRGLVARQSSL